MMGLIYAPDPFPGRCLNTRPVTGADGYPSSHRCLDYEGHDGACRFLAAPRRYLPSASNQTYQQRTPELNLLERTPAPAQALSASSPHTKDGR